MFTLKLNVIHFFYVLRSMIRYTWPALVWSLIILVATLTPGKELPEVDFFQFDKLVHFFIFAVLMVLSSYGSMKINNHKSLPFNPLFISTFYSISFGVLIEVLQQFVPGRNFSLADILANSIGVGLGYFAFSAIKKRKAL